MTKTHYIAAAAAMLISSTAWAGALTIPNTFSAGTPAVAADVNTNFTAAKTAVDDNNTRITANTTNIAGNATNITALQSAKPGYATAVAGTNPNAGITMTGTGQAIVTLTLNAPASGFAIVTGRVISLLPHTLATQSIVIIKVSATSGDVALDYDVSVAQVQAPQPTGSYVKMIAATSVIPVVAGANIIYLNGYDPQGTGLYSVLQPKLTAIYVPNAY